MMPWAAAVITGSVLGVLTNAWVASRGVLMPAPLTTPRMAATAFDQLAAGPSAIMHQALSGIPATPAFFSTLATTDWSSLSS